MLSLGPTYGAETYNFTGRNLSYSDLTEIKMSEDETVKAKENQLKIYRKSRGGHRSYTTKIVQESTGLLENAAVNTSEDERVKL